MKPSVCTPKCNYYSTIIYRKAQLIMVNNFLIVYIIILD